VLELFAIRFCPHTSKWRMKDTDGGWRVRTHLNTSIESNVSVFFNFWTRKMCADDGWRVRTHVNTALIDGINSLSSASHTNPKPRATTRCLWTKVCRMLVFAFVLKVIVSLCTGYLYKLYIIEWFSIHAHVLKNC